MSRIYFHEQGKPDVEIRGSERALMGCMTKDISRAALGSVWRDHWILNGFPPDHYIHTTGRFDEQTVMAALRDDLVFGGERYDVFALELNTATVLGGEAMKLSARIHGQCEIWLRIEGANRAWLADMVDRSLKDRVFRPDSGWESASARLRECADAPMVMSYSVCSQFPCSEVAGIKYDEDHPEEFEKFDEASEDEQWAICLPKLRAGYPELKPDDFDAYRFGHRLTYMDLAAIVTAK